MTGWVKVFRSLRGRQPVVQRVWEVLRPSVYRVAGVVLRRGLAVPLATGHVIRVHPAFLGWNLEHYEADLMLWLKENVRTGTTFFDVGAHVGFFTALVSSLVGQTGRVVAIEASPATAALLRRHLSMNGIRNVTVVEALAGDMSGNMHFVARPSPIDPGACANSIAYAIEGGRASQVRVITLDEVARTTEVLPSIVKIDVEGAELKVLQGAVELLRTASPTVVCSVHPDVLPLLGQTGSELVTWMAVQGYRCTSLAGEPIATPAAETVVFWPAGHKRERSQPRV